MLRKKRRIDELLEENRQLKTKLRYRERKEKEGFFGASTPRQKDYRGRKPTEERGSEDRPSGPWPEKPRSR
jgi:hypothetical protein